jgi:polysaccharide biosynthesis transport protein
VSRIYEALRQLAFEAPPSNGLDVALPLPPAASGDPLAQVQVERLSSECVAQVRFHAEPEGLLADRFRVLRMRLRELATRTTLKSILVTSPLASEGKTTTALNLAASLAEDGNRRVVLVDTDLHRGSLNDRLGLLQGSGIAHCLQAPDNVVAQIRRVEPLNIYYLQSGSQDVNCDVNLLHTAKMGAVMEKLQQLFDWIIIDCAPVLLLSDALALKQHVDGTLMVVRSGCTPIKALEDALNLMGRNQVLGIVLNAVEDPRQLYSKEYRRYRRPSL